MEKRFVWLSSGDVEIRQKLLNHFLEEEKRLIANDARNRTQIILRHLERKEHWTEEIKQEYTIGNHKLALFFDSRVSGIQEGRPANYGAASRSPSETAISVRGQAGIRH